MNAQRVVLVVAVLAAGYLMFRRPGQQAAARLIPGGHAPNGDGTTVDAAGNWWYRGQMLYKAPAQGWSV